MVNFDPYTGFQAVGQCSSITGCIHTTIYNTGTQSFWGLLEELYHYVYHVILLDPTILQWSVLLLYLFLLLSFVVGFIFFVRR